MEDRKRDGGTNSTLRTKEQGTHLTLKEHDDDDDDDDDDDEIIKKSVQLVGLFHVRLCNKHVTV